MDPNDTPDYTKIPDADTLERIRNLALVGKGVSQRSSDKDFETIYYIAKEALNKFEEGINKLELEEESRDGMRKLIEYLRVKVNKRLNSSTHMSNLD